MDTYEKKYNEALERARKIHNEILDNEILGFPDQIREIFPELRGSEDERIRKWLIDYFSSIKETVWIHRDITCEQILGWLEKQKENPKNADSISADCVSSAKCEDRWHKVTDSLPDNPREVLCKDEAGNYFIGRYYVGEGWEISNYDDEDKPHHLNPPVSKWIAFPSEKQKEQNLVPCNAQCGECPCFISGMNYQKEQKPAWSEEDKTHLNWIIECLGSWKYQVPEFADQYQFAIDFLKSLRPQPKQEWSEDDEKMLEQVVDVVYDYCPDPVAKYKLKDWLNLRFKSIRPCPSWKPSEEQMRCFDMVLCDEAMDENVHRVLVQLREQLKRLM